MKMRHTESLIFTAEQNGNLECIKSALNKNFIKLRDTLKLYEISSQKNDLLNISLNEIESCDCCNDEINRLNNLLSCLDQYKIQVTVEENPESIKLELNFVSVVTTELSEDLINGSFTVLRPKIKLLKQKCPSLYQELKSLIPELESHELQRTKFSALEVCDELTGEIDGVPVLNVFMKFQTSFPKSESFFNNEEYLKMFITATPAKNLLIPGYSYFSMLHNFINRHFELGEKHLEFL